MLNLEEDEYTTFICKIFVLSLFLPLFTNLFTINNKK